VATQVSNGATVPVDNKIGNCTTISGSSLPTTIQPAQPINSIQFWGKIGYGAANSSQAGLNVAQPGRLRFLNVAVNPAPGGTITDRAYVYLGGATTALTCTITGTNKVCLDNSHEVAISPGAPDGGYIQYTTGNGGSARNISWSLEYCTGA
jgi:hypothetical protein